VGLGRVRIHENLYSQNCLENISLISAQKEPIPWLMWRMKKRKGKAKNKWIQSFFAILIEEYKFNTK
jgi:hypothetical protein